MSSIVPALKADDGIGALGQPVDNLAFAFVAPLSADHGYIRHKFLKFFEGLFLRTRKFAAKGFAVPRVKSVSGSRPP